MIVIGVGSVKYYGILNFIWQLIQLFCLTFGICDLYTLLSHLCKFHKDQASSLDVLVV